MYLFSFNNSYFDCSHEFNALYTNRSILEGSGKYSFVSDQFQGCSTNKRPLTDKNSDTCGGALFFENQPKSELTLKDCDFNECFAYSNGGSIFASSIGVVETENCTFKLNSVRFGGGGSVFFMNVKESLHLYQNQFERSSSYQEGGAAYIWNCKVDSKYTSDSSDEIRIALDAVGFQACHIAMKSGGNSAGGGCYVSSSGNIAEAGYLCGMKNITAYRCTSFIGSGIAWIIFNGNGALNEKTDIPVIFSMCFLVKNFAHSNYLEDFKDMFLKDDMFLYSKNRSPFTESFTTSENNFIVLKHPNETIQLGNEWITTYSGRLVSPESGEDDSMCGFPGHSPCFTLSSALVNDTPISVNVVSCLQGIYSHESPVALTSFQTVMVNGSGPDVVFLIGNEDRWNDEGRKKFDDRNEGNAKIFEKDYFKRQGYGFDIEQSAFYVFEVRSAYLTNIKFQINISFFSLNHLSLICISKTVMEFRSISISPFSGVISSADSSSSVMNPTSSFEYSFDNNFNQNNTLEGDESSPYELAMPLFNCINEGIIRFHDLEVSSFQLIDVPIIFIEYLKENVLVNASLFKSISRRNVKTTRSCLKLHSHASSFFEESLSATSSIIVIKNCMISNELFHIKNCTFVECTSEDSKGGAVFVACNEKMGVYVQNSTFCRCSAGNGYGGGVYLDLSKLRSLNENVTLFSFLLDSMKNNSAQFGRHVFCYILSAEMQLFDVQWSLDLSEISPSDNGLIAFEKDSRRFVDVIELFIQYQGHFVYVSGENGEDNPNCGDKQENGCRTLTRSICHLIPSKFGVLYVVGNTRVEKAQLLRSVHFISANEELNDEKCKIILSSEIKDFISGGELFQCVDTVNIDGLCFPIASFGIKNPLTLFDVNGGNFEISRCDFVNLNNEDILLTYSIIMLKIGRCTVKNLLFKGFSSSTCLFSCFEESKLNMSDVMMQDLNFKSVSVIDYTPYSEATSARTNIIHQITFEHSSLLHTVFFLHHLISGANIGNRHYIFDRITVNNVSFSNDSKLFLFDSLNWRLDFVNSTFSNIFVRNHNDFSLFTIIEQEVLFENCIFTNISIDTPNSCSAIFHSEQQLASSRKFPSLLDRLSFIDDAFHSFHPHVPDYSMKAPSEIGEINKQSSSTHSSLTSSYSSKYDCKIPHINYPEQKEANDFTSSMYLKYREQQNEAVIKQSSHSPIFPILSSSSSFPPSPSTEASEKILSSNHLSNSPIQTDLRVFSQVLTSSFLTESTDNHSLCWDENCFMHLIECNGSIVNCTFSRIKRNALRITKSHISMPLSRFSFNKIPDEEGYSSLRMNIFCENSTIALGDIDTSEDIEAGNNDWIVNKTCDITNSGSRSIFATPMLSEVEKAKEGDSYRLTFHGSYFAPCNLSIVLLLSTNKKTEEVVVAIDSLIDQSTVVVTFAAAIMDRCRTATCQVVVRITGSDNIPYDSNPLEVHMTFTWVIVVTIICGMLLLIVVCALALLFTKLYRKRRFQKHLSSDPIYNEQCQLLNATNGYEIISYTDNSSSRKSVIVIPTDCQLPNYEED